MDAIILDCITTICSEVCLSNIRASGYSVSGQHLVTRLHYLTQYSAVLSEVVELYQQQIHSRV